MQLTTNKSKLMNNWGLRFLVEMAVIPHGPACNPCQNDIVFQESQQSGTFDQRVWSSGSLNKGDSNEDETRPAAEVIYINKKPWKFLWRG